MLAVGQVQVLLENTGGFLWLESVGDGSLHSLTTSQSVAIVERKPLQISSAHRRLAPGCRGSCFIAHETPRSASGNAFLTGSAVLTTGPAHVPTQEV